MGTFSFDDQAVMFDITPLENQFILEYMLNANGDFVKVYIYGLLQCHYPQAAISFEKMAEELGMQEADVLKAYRYWERKGLVHRVSDNPPSFQYVNIKQQSMMGGLAAADPAYEAFAESIYTLFGNDRSIHGKEMVQCYEWVEDLGLPAEVVIMLMQHMIAVKGKHFSLKSAEKLAMQLADMNVRTIEDAEHALGIERSVWDGSRKVLRRMGKRRDPSDDEMNLYRKWIRDWGYAPEAVEEACAETTKGEPTFAYLDGILKGMLQRRGKAMTTGREMEAARQAEKESIAPLKELLRVLGIRDLAINDGTVQVYREMQAMYPDEIILMAGRECATKRGCTLDSVLMLLEAWQKRDLKTADDITLHLQHVKELDKQLNALYSLWGSDAKPSRSDRTLLEKWTDELKLNLDFIIGCASFALGAQRPMAYLDAVLTDFARKGIVTLDAAQAEHAAHKESVAAVPAMKPAGKVVREQQYEQREYKAETGLPDWMKAELEKMNHDS